MILVHFLPDRIGLLNSVEFEHLPFIVFPTERKKKNYQAHECLIPLSREAPAMW